MSPIPLPSVINGCRVFLEPAQPYLGTSFPTTFGGALASILTAFAKSAQSITPAIKGHCHSRGALSLAPLQLVAEDLSQR
jgi:hypothetical protein